MINLKSSRGAITLYILISLLFFIIALVNVNVHLKSREDSAELEYQKVKINYEQDANEVYNNIFLEENKTVASLKETGATIVGRNIVLTDKNGYTITIPKNFRIAPESPTLVTEGVIIEDSQANQYVWVPIFSNEKFDWGVDYTAVESLKQYTDEYYTAIETALKNYTNTYIDNSYKDEWYGDENYGLYGYYEEKDTEKANLIYYTNGNMSEDEYKTLYNNMLNSIYLNEGFYIGRYEMGIEVVNTTTEAETNSRTKASKEYAASSTNTSNEAPTIEGMNIPVSKANAVGYNYITQSQAQMLAEKLGEGTDYSSVTSSIMFGVQWDAVCVFLEHYGKIDSSAITNAGESFTSSYLTSNDYSKYWGNYNNSTFKLNRGYYTTTYSSETVTWNENYTTAKGTTDIWLCTTGASNQNSSLNIYDFGGNLSEWTLERSSDADFSCALRGHYFVYSQYASNRIYDRTFFSSYVSSSRVSLYIK